MIPVWLILGSLSLGLPSSVLRVLVPLECTCIPLFLHSFLNFSLVPGMKGTTMVMFLLLGLLSCWLLLLVLLLLVGWFGFVNLWCHWLRAQCGNWHACSAVLMCCSSFSGLSCEDETTLTLWANVLITLCFAVMWWLLSQCKYWCVWLGFL